MSSDISILESGNEKWFKITNFDHQRPFFMSVVSDSNHWMFISSNGGLTAGRKNSEFALFPYYTDDKITDLAETTGSKTIFRVGTGDAALTWEPFSIRNQGKFDITRNLYKNKYGNKVRFEEVNHTLGLSFSYEWNSSNLFGFVKKSALQNLSGETQHVELLDGIQNVLPYGIESAMQSASSNLADAYKRSELVKDTGVGIFALSAIIVDKAEPSEALKTNIAWSLGLDNPTYLLSSLQLKHFRSGENVQQETDIKGEKGAYFVQAGITLGSDEQKQWNIVANVNQNQSQIIALNKAIGEDEDLKSRLEEDIDRGTDKLFRLTNAADAMQLSSDELKNARHYSNVLFNIMRGGIFDDDYRIEKRDFLSYLEGASRDVYRKYHTIADSLDEIFDKSDLERVISQYDDADLKRLAIEYLPLKFSRRHGDPSRPWNRFSINTRSEVDGSKILDYEGNWRDIFQNWEALVHSYPDFIEGMIYKFLNASTFDGYNPYRVTKGGFDWETIDPDDPWSYIGYWGDHQIIYLLKFLEFYRDLQADAADRLFKTDCFVYANVPYRIKSYGEISKDPKNTIDFDEESDSEIRQKVDQKGADGALLSSSRNDIHHVNFLEKILATVLSKVSNFIPEAGIWMNTQRPEWNDANNALVGNGVSMVTLYYLRRFLNFLEDVLTDSDTDEVLVSEELAGFFNRISEILSQNRDLLDGHLDDGSRKAVTDALGMAGSDYRHNIYDNGFSGDKQTVTTDEIAEFVRIALEWTDHTISLNRRDDHLFHAYNLMSIKPDGISVSRLDEMLEGQVAVLSCGILDANESLQLLDALRNSKLYRPDQNSYMLYPNKDLPGFLEKNTIPEELVKKSRLLMQMVSDDNKSIINRDVEGGYHFNGNFRNAGDLKKALEKLKSTKYGDLIHEEEELILDIFEEVFNHKAFTGRSGTFFAYEGLGSIYWHMVSKLHLAVTEVCLNAVDKQADADVVGQLKEHFHEIGKGIGIHKSPERYGAFPTDPYSHTPFHRGAQQPGMTGQVKEDILVRQGELGLSIENGQLFFEPVLLQKAEFLQEEASFKAVPVGKDETSIELLPGSLGFTCCQVPVIYRISEKEGIEVQFADGQRKRFDSLNMDEETSRMIFGRTGDVQAIHVELHQSRLS
ncbi:hypothetical protein [Rhodohalobacter mucosus]|uniref:Cellobiose phosphorylase n=1 Tax=Rhodohalobacter mucosus TaxID=2079485 RepID=A0A316TV19_9BACT|nr:hypothetical protein [Rhodohalobacter mucosus]PWN06222.1 hypothetical protein DDZ15_10335 [Rhodohalobacter mucosus]